MTFKGYPNILGSDSDRTMRRVEYVVALSGSPFQILGPNPRRVGCIVGFVAPSGVQPVSVSRYWHSVDVSVTATLATYTVPAGVAVNLQMLFVNFTVSLKFSLFLTRSSTTYTVYGPATGLNVNLQIFGQLVAGDVIFVQNSTTGAATSDGGLIMTATPFEQSCNISVNKDSVGTSSLTLRTLQEPLILWRDVIGDALTEGLWGISTDNAPYGSVYALDLFT